MSYLFTVRLARRAALACAAIALVSACASLQKPVSLAETIAKTPELSTLNGLVKTAGLTETLLQFLANLNVLVKQSTIVIAIREPTRIPSAINTEP